MITIPIFFSNEKKKVVKLFGNKWKIFMYIFKYNYNSFMHVDWYYIEFKYFK